MAISKDETIYSPDFVRHVQLGPGKVVDQKANRITVQFRNPNGRLEDKTYIYEIDDWKIKEIFENSIGGLFFQEPEKVISIIDDHHPEIVELCLRESNGEATQKEIRGLLEPLVTANNHEWNKWWKKVGQRLRNYKSVSFDKKEKVYKILDTQIQKSTLSGLTTDSIGAYESDQLADLSELIFDRIPEFQGIDKALMKALWDRLCQVINEISPRGREVSALLALGELLSDLLSIQNPWISLIRKWVGNDEVNVLGIRDSKIREYALKALGNLEWKKKRETLAFYILHEESGEKNRMLASRLLWFACKNEPKQYFDFLIKATRALRVLNRSPLIFIPSRAKRVLNCSVEFIREIQEYNMIKTFCAASTKLLISFFTSHFPPPLESKLAQDMLLIWLVWKRKVENLLSPADTWIIWINFPLILRSCSEHGRQAFYGNKDVDVNKWIENISSALIEQANEDRIDNAATLYDLLTLIMDRSKAEQRLRLALNDGVFRSQEAKEWALSHTVKHKIHYEPKTIQNEVIEKQFAEIALHPKEKRIATDFGRLLLILKEKETSLLEGISNLEELVYLYEPARIDSIQAVKSFTDLIKDSLYELKDFLKLEFVGAVGEIEEYNFNKHELVDKAIQHPKYVEILYSGIGKRMNNGFLEIILKAIVNPITGGSS